MRYRMEQDGRTLVLFLLFSAASLAALVGACAVGRRWGDYASRIRYGEVLAEEEQTERRRSRRLFFIWAGISAALAVSAFFILQRS